MKKSLFMLAAVLLLQGWPAIADAGETGNNDATTADAIAAGAPADTAKKAVKKKKPTVPAEKTAAAKKPGKSAVNPAHAVTDEREFDPDPAENTSAAADRKNKARSRDAFEEALEYYRYGEFEEAIGQIEQAVRLDPANSAALDLQVRINKMQQKIEEIKHDFSEQCYYRAVNAYTGNDKNVLEALLSSKQALRFNPDSTKANDFFTRVAGEAQAYVRTMSARDVKRFSKAVKSFLAEDFKRAAGIFRDLQAYYPEITDLLAVAETHASDDVNSRRSQEYYRRAITEIAAERYAQARENLHLALEMDRMNIDARIRLAQVNIELGNARTSAIGQD